jgi:hypothetical protein
MHKVWNNANPSKIQRESHVFQNYEKTCLELCEVFRHISLHKMWLHCIYNFKLPFFSTNILLPNIMVKCFTLQFQIQFSAWRLAILTEDFHSSHQSHQAANGGMSPSKSHTCFLPQLLSLLFTLILPYDTIRPTQLKSFVK